MSKSKNQELDDLVAQVRSSLYVMRVVGTIYSET